MNNLGDKDYAAEYLRLKAANEALREKARLWVWEVLNGICAELNRGLTVGPGEEAIQVGLQEWTFAVESATLVGERFGARRRGRTLIVEIGWPRLPEHGYLTEGGLARGRIGFSQNVMLDPRPVAEIILKRAGGGEPRWHLISNQATGEQLTETHLRNFLEMVMRDTV